MTREEYEHIVGGVNLGRLIDRVTDVLCEAKARGWSYTDDKDYDDICDVIDRLREAGEKTDHFREPAKMVWHDAAKDPPKKEGFYWTVGFYLTPPSYERMPCRRVRLVKYSKILSADLGVEYYWEDVLNVTKWREADVPPLPEEEEQ